MLELSPLGTDYIRFITSQAFAKDVTGKWNLLYTFFGHALFSEGGGTPFY